MSQDLKQQQSHFAFGENWAAFAELIEPSHIEEAEKGLRALVDRPLDGLTMLDLGSGSGIHSLSALNAGVAQVNCVDIDPNSVATTRAVLSHFHPDGPWRCRQRSVFDMKPEEDGLYDLVYSWGVLHHTGSMYEAIEKAAALVKPDGRLVLAIYLKTPFCPAWVVEKKLYTWAPRWLSRPFFWLFSAIKIVGLSILQRDLHVVKNYRKKRGMDFYRDIEDWLGGYPYESASADEISTFMGQKGFTLVKSQRAGKVPFWGLFGTWCAEYCFQKC
uniref:Putative 3-demethylubiquinone-9 3-methyltransferase n=1 Tax=Magnetococcus massalia (strain MO-1) TaxID=451514 RepID=A0A1S7LG77_MAGMO|nr:putative 3-demethylubiquinone-9 3-methyltransferase [Candidatus Magnetococcus massalia]